MWLLDANASMYVVFAFATVVFEAPTPALKSAALYGPWTFCIQAWYRNQGSPVSARSHHDLNVKPEQSPPSPSVFGSSVGSPGESSTLLPFQQPPPHW